MQRVNYLLNHSTEPDSCRSFCLVFTTSTIEAKYTSTPAYWQDPPFEDLIPKLIMCIRAHMDLWDLFTYDQWDAENIPNKVDIFCPFSSSCQPSVSGWRRAVFYRGEQTVERNQERKDQRSSSTVVIDDSFLLCLRHWFSHFDWLFFIHNTDAWGWGTMLT